MRDILLIDDDAEVLQSLAKALSPLVQGLSLCAATSATEGLKLLTSENPRVVVLDLCLDPRASTESGFSALREIRALDPHARVIVLTGHGSTVNGVRALSLGASSFLEKPIDPAHLAALVKDAAAQAELRREHARLATRAVSPAQELLCGRSVAVESLRERIAFLAATPQSVLILGETGVGKGVCARAIHELSARRSGKFVHYQPHFGGGDIVHSELFGHVRGSFTGATESRRGLALDADRGTLFIDELDEVPLETQVRLLDLIQEKRVRALGSDSLQQIDCRFIAATNRDIAEAVATGKLRRDLHFRLGQSTLHVPALRERLEDIPNLVELFLRRLRERESLNVFEASRQVLEGFAGRLWEGNVRELQAATETAAYHAHFAGRTVIEPLDVEGPSRASHYPVAAASDSGLTLHEQVELFKSEIIERALAQAGGSQVQAARVLGVDRGLLRRALARSGCRNA